MKRSKIFALTGSICLILVLVMLSLTVACGPAAREKAEVMFFSAPQGGTTYTCFFAVSMHLSRFRRIKPLTLLCYFRRPGP